MFRPLRSGRAAARTDTRRNSRRMVPGVSPLDPRMLLSGLSAAEPTADEQYLLQLANRARANPAAEAQRLLAISKADPTIQAALPGWDASAFLQEMDSHAASPPLAFNPRLVAAARTHDDAMVAANNQVHTPSGSVARPTTPDQLAPDGQPFFPTGDSYWSSAENVFAYSANLPDPHGQALDNYFHEAFLLDWGNPDFGHLKNLLSPGPSAATAAGTYPMSEVGIGLLTDAHPTAPPPSVAGLPGNQGLNVGPALVTEEFAWRSGHEFLTGAIYNDSNNDQFYEPGEGLGGVKIEAVGRHSEGTFDALTWGSGGYSLDLPAGTYDVTASGGGLASPRTTTVTVGRDNVGWDVIQSPGGGSSSFVPAPTNSGTPITPNGSPSSSPTGSKAIATPSAPAPAIPPWSPRSLTGVTPSAM